MIGMNKIKQSDSQPILQDMKVNPRILLAGFWISQFLLWTFGDMVSLLQEINDPISNNLLAFVAAPLALIQASMIILSLAGPVKVVRLFNIIVVPIFILFNIGFLAEGKYMWQFLLGTGYIIINILTLIYAWKWSRSENISKGEIA
jgi:hypothetical protein